MPTLMPTLMPAHMCLLMTLMLPALTRVEAADNTIADLHAQIRDMVVYVQATDVDAIKWFITTYADPQGAARSEISDVIAQEFIDHHASKALQAFQLILTIAPAETEGSPLYTFDISSLNLNDFPNELVFIYRNDLRMFYVRD